MRTWIILPYDGSPVARVTLRRAAEAVRKDGGQYAGVILATAGVDPGALDAWVREAEEVAGPDVPLEIDLLDAGDPLGAFDALVDAYPDAILAGPIGARGNAPWYADACVLGGRSHGLMLFFVAPAEIAELMEERHERRGMGGVVDAVLRAGAWLRLCVRALVGGGAR